MTIATCSACLGSGFLPGSGLCWLCGGRGMRLFPQPLISPVSFPASDDTREPGKTHERSNAPQESLRYRVYRCCKTCGKWEARNLTTHIVEYRALTQREAMAWARTQLRDATNQPNPSYTLTALQDLKLIRQEHRLPDGRQKPDNPPSLRAAYLGPYAEEPERFA